MKKLFNIVKLCLKNIKLFMQSWANCISLAFVFTVCIFAPLDYFFASRSEFWFSFVDILIPVVVVSVTAGVALWVVFKFLKQTVKQVTAAIVFSITIAAYIQGNFLNINYGVLDGQTINWAQYRTHGMVNALIWIAIIILMVVLYAKFKEKFLGVARFAALFLVGMQAITLITNGTIVELATGKQDPYYLSDKGAFELSSNKNTIVFVLDTFSEKLITQVVQKDPEILDSYDGFTWYVNSVAEYSATDGGVPFLMTGAIYKNEIPYRDFLSQSYKSTPFYKDLIANQYTVGLYTNKSIYIPPTEKTDIINMICKNIPVSSYTKLGGMVYQMTGFRYLPHFLKEFFSLNTEDFYKLQGARKNLNAPWSVDNLSFYDRLKNQGLTLTEDENAYRFYHLWGAHPPFVLNEDIKEDSSATRMTQAKATLKMVDEYLTQMKELGIYDDASIIITADHATLGEFENKTLFLYKAPQQQGPIKKNFSLISQRDFQASIMADISEDYEKYGQPIQFLDGTEKRDIFTYAYRFGTGENPQYLPKMTEYVATLFKDDVILYPTGHLYKEAVSFTSKGPEYTMDQSSTMKVYFDGINEDNWAACTGGPLSMSFVEPFAQEDLYVTIGILGAYTDQQRMRIFYKDHVLYDRVVNQGTPEISFIVPKEAVEENNLLLTLLFPDAKVGVPEEISGDVRILAFAFSDIVIKPISCVFSTYSMENDKQLSFSESEKAVSYFTEGTVRSEWKTLWTVGKQGHINLLLEEIPPKNSQMVLQLANVFNGPQRLIVKNKENIIYDEIITEADTQIAIPVTESCFEGRLLQLELEYPNAVSAVTLGTGQDIRELAFGFSGMELVPILGDNDEHLFSTEEQVLANFPSGMFLSEWGTGWTLGAKGGFTMELKEAPKKDAQLIFKLSNVFNGPQRFIVKSNGTVIFEKTITEGDSQIAVPVSSACFNGNLLELDLEYPDAISAKELGVSEDIRELALGFSGFQLVETTG